MKTECQNQLFELQPLGRRDVVAEFSGGTITSDAGGVLLREVEERTGLNSGEFSYIGQLFLRRSLA